MQENERRKQEAIAAHKAKEKKLEAFKPPSEPIVVGGKLFVRISVPKSDADDIPIQVTITTHILLHLLDLTECGLISGAWSW